MSVNWRGLVEHALLICVQQATALTEIVNNFEVKRSEVGTDQNQGRNATKTNLGDVSHFRDSNKRTKLKLLQQKDRVEQDIWRLRQEHADKKKEEQRLETQSKLLPGFVNNEMNKGSNGPVELATKIAFGKCEELEAAELQVLASAGDKFGGCREVLHISDRALQDMSSALKEIGTACSTSDGAHLVDTVESNLKLRKHCNALVQTKLLRAKTGQTSQEQKPTHKGILQFFSEAHMPDQS